MHSCLYIGRVAHQRREPVTHRFRYRVALAYLDLDEAGELVRASRVLSAAAYAPMSFRASDHARGLADAATSHGLAEAIREIVARESGRRPAGPVRLLTPLRSWGVWFGPLCLYYCFDSAGNRVDAVVAEVSNTPWNERRRYVLANPQQVDGRGEMRFRHAKDFHVSPFMGMDMRYDWRVSVPGERLRVGIRCVRTRTPAAEGAMFAASLALIRRPWSDRALAGLACRFPAANATMLAAIYWQAFRLWIKRCPYFPHPRTTAA